MKTETKTKETNLFAQWINTIPIGMYDEIKLRVIQECKITNQIFKHWKAGNTKVPNLAKPIIEAIAGKQVFTNSTL